MCNNCYNGCGNNRYYEGEEFANYDNFSGGTGCGCGCNRFGDEAFDRAARVNQRILARRCCEDRAAAQYLRNICRCRRCW